MGLSAAVAAGLVLQALALLYALWAFFLAVMALKRAKDAGQLSRPARLLGMPIVIVGLWLDFWANVLVATVLLLELPRQTTVTARLKRHTYLGLEAAYHDRPTPWRTKVSKWVCSNFLDVFDPSGQHCDCGAYEPPAHE
jgi:hypothetical protein